MRSRRIAIFKRSFLCAFVSFIDDALHFLVDLNGGVFGIVAVLAISGARKMLHLSCIGNGQARSCPIRRPCCERGRWRFDVVAGPRVMWPRKSLPRKPAHENGEHGLEILCECRCAYRPRATAW